MYRNGLSTLVCYNPVTVSPSSTLEVALAHFRSGVRHLPVVDAANQVVGLLSSDGADDAVSGNSHADKPWLVSISDVMENEICTINLDTSPHDAWDRMRAVGVNTAAVLEDGRLVGIVSSDVLAGAIDGRRCG